MISEQDFNDLFVRMIYLTGLSFKKDAIRYYYEEFMKVETNVIQEAFEQMIKKPPTKLSKSAVVNAVSMAKKKLCIETVSGWDGTPCTFCQEGLFFTIVENCSYVWRCGRCNSYHAPIIPIYSSLRLQDLTEKLSKGRLINAEIKADPRPVREDIKSIVKTVLPGAVGMDKNE